MEIKGGEATEVKSGALVGKFPHITQSLNQDVCITKSRLTLQPEGLEGISGEALENEKRCQTEGRYLEQRCNIKLGRMQSRSLGRRLCTSTIAEGKKKGNKSYKQQRPNFPIAPHSRFSYRSSWSKMSLKVKPPSGALHQQSHHFSPLQRHSRALSTLNPQTHTHRQFTLIRQFSYWPCFGEELIINFYAFP